MGMNFQRLLSTVCVTWTIFLLPLYAISKTEQKEYTESMFRHAVEHEGTDQDYHSSEYVLITITGRSSRPSRTVCVQAKALLYAIRKEQISKRHIADAPSLTLSKAESNESIDDDVGAYKQIALSAPDRRFCLDDQKAYEAVVPKYDKAQLSRVRKILSAYTNEQLSTAVRDAPSNSPVHRLYLENHYPKSVVAHSLLERGILVGVTMENGNLYVVAPAEIAR